MIVPNYVPDPIEIPGNVHLEPYFVRLQFIQRVNLLHVASLGLVGILYSANLPELPLLVSLGLLAGCLLALSVVRVSMRGGRSEVAVSLMVLPAALACVALTLQAATRLGWPIWIGGWGAAATLLYAALAGRDFSFVGQYFLTLIASSAAIGFYAANNGWNHGEGAIGLAANFLFLSYSVYDRSMLMYRRRVGEEWAAVVDLYRDVFNVFGYLVRCVQHWRRHRIWVVPR